MIWKVHPKKSDDLIEQLLLNRDISKKEKEIFFNPKLLHFEKDLKIPNIKKAQERISSAIEKNELIII